VCTGNDANDLAFRIARTVTGNDGAIVTEHAYHGNSLVVTELSTDEYPASERPDYLEAVEAPNLYRGRYRSDEPDSGSRYAALSKQAIEALAARGHRLAMFICDNIFSSNGILTPPPEYLRGMYREVRAAGGLIVADEVQSGLCRLGDHIWGFEDSGVIPDIVTMGKPIGDGHPLAAVVTTPIIAEEFARKFHYFNTFGGNPVSTAVGLAVLDVIENENILQNVHNAGTCLRSRSERGGENPRIVTQKWSFAQHHRSTEQRDQDPSADGLFRIQCRAFAGKTGAGVDCCLARILHQYPRRWRNMRANPHRALSVGQKVRFQNP
jgi:4-aminobutyrate aminotransferase-like enzyme